MNVRNELDIYYIDGDKTVIGRPIIVITNHRIRNEIVQIEIGGKIYGVRKDQLLIAIENSTNWK